MAHQISFRITLVLLLGGITACAADPLPTTQPYTPGRVYLLHLPGIGGLMRIDRRLTSGILTGGFDADINIYDWTKGDPGFPALMAIERNRKEALNVAKLIETRLADEPDAKIVITCHSGGAGIAVWALENLPDDVQIDTLVMLAPALSPAYDLSNALRRVRNRAYSFNSEHDPILGPGTRTFGTIDRIKTNAAGRVGFEIPPDADPEQYAKLRQFPYDRAWRTVGNVGDHIGTMGSRFAARVIAPLLLTGEIPLPLPTTIPSASTTAPSR